jgi:hypothetical protein
LLIENAAHLKENQQANQKVTSYAEENRVTLQNIQIKIKKGKVMMRRTPRLTKSTINNRILCNRGPNHNEPK